MKKFFLFFLMLLPIPCMAQNLIDAKKVEHVGKFEDWDAYIYQNKDRKEKVCFVSSMPLKSGGEYNRRGDVFLLISHRPLEDMFDVVTFVAGYTFMPRSEVLFRVGNVKAKLFTSEDTAWAKNLKTDDDIAKAMKNAVRVTVKGLTIEGIQTQDSFSMKGFNDAMDAVNRLCRQPLGPKN